MRCWRGPKAICLCRASTEAILNGTTFAPSTGTFIILMPDIHTLIQSGSSSVWLYIPVAILLGALHGLEPGHSKTMMAAFIIAIRGTVWQAVLLGLSAAISHSLLIWVLAALPRPTRPAPTDRSCA